MKIHGFVVKITERNLCKWMRLKNVNQLAELRSSRSKVMLPEVMLPETKVMLPEIQWHVARNSWSCRPKSPKNQVRVNSLGAYVRN